MVIDTAKTHTSSIRYRRHTGQEQHIPRKVPSMEDRAKLLAITVRLSPEKLLPLKEYMTKKQLLLLA